jgi:hypothetical protein
MCKIKLYIRKKYRRKLASSAALNSSGIHVLNYLVQTSSSGNFEAIGIIRARHIDPVDCPSRIVVVSTVMIA